MKICGLELEDNSPIVRAIAACDNCQANREGTVVDEMTGEEVPAGLECCVNHGNELAQIGVRCMLEVDTDIQNAVDDLLIPF